MAKRQFKAESKRLMDLMINSIYTHKEVFLREIISNASDALDKYYFEAIKGGETGVSRGDLKIFIKADKDARTLTVSDNGCGMTKDELCDNLGTIAKSGTGEFRSEHADESDAEIIGQFGVGFYSAFMVSRRIVVKSRAYGGDEAWQWESEGVDGYTVEPCEKDSHGTEVTLYLSDDQEDEDYSRFLDQYTLQSLVKKYSDYIRFPIIMDMTRSRPKQRAEGEDASKEPEWEDYTEAVTLNSMVPIWRKGKGEVTKEEYAEFYKGKFSDWEDPLRVITAHVEGAVTYDALLFLPSSLPFDYYSKNYEKGLSLYCNGVMIMEKCAELLPDHYGFVRGVVDSEDFSLNISREVLQHDGQLKLIAKKLEQKITSELEKMLEEEREAYEKFFGAFGLQLKYGLYSDYGAHKDELKDLVLFHSVAENKLLTFKEYTAKMPEGQKYIYYACGATAAKVASLPQTDAIREKGWDILAMTDDVDEFAVKVLREYDGHEFKSVSDSDLGLETEEQKAEIERETKDNRPLLDEMQKALDGKVKAVRLSARLKKHPVCLVADGDLSMDMEKVLNAMPTDQHVQAERVLEINADHPVFKALTASSGDSEKVARYARLLYDQALLIAGMTIDDPVAFSSDICELMAK